MDPISILITCPPMMSNLSRYNQRFVDLNLEVYCPKSGSEMKLDEGTLLKIVPNYQVWIIGDEKVNAKILQAGKNGKLEMAIRWGIGTDNVDVETCRKLGIYFSNTPGLLGVEVTENIMGYLVNLSRQTSYIDRQIRKGQWPKPTGVSLNGKIICVIGFGNIGQTLVPRLIYGFNCQVIVVDPLYHKVIEKKEERIYNMDNTKYLIGCDKFNLANSLEEGVSCADYIVLCCQLNESTRGMINLSILGKMKQSVYLVNVSRGPIVNYIDLIYALNHKMISGAALDVYPEEPLKINSPLLEMDNVILGSHNSSNTVEGVDRVSHKVLDLIGDYYSIKMY